MSDNGLLSDSSDVLDFCENLHLSLSETLAILAIVVESKGDNYVLREQLNLISRELSFGTTVEVAEPEYVVIHIHSGRGDDLGFQKSNVLATHRIPVPKNLSDEEIERIAEKCLNESVVEGSRSRYRCWWSTCSREEYLKEPGVTWFGTSDRNHDDTPF